MSLIATSKDDLVAWINGQKIPLMEFSRTAGAEAPEGIREEGKVVGLALGSEKEVEGSVKVSYENYLKLTAIADTAGVTLSRLYPGTLTYSLKEKYNLAGGIASRLTSGRTKTIKNVVLYENSIAISEGDKRVPVDIKMTGTAES